MIKSLESFVFGLLLGVCLTVVIGFGVYDWTTMTRGTAKSEKDSDLAVVNALSAVCVERFKSDPNYNANLLKFSAGDFMEIGGWSKFSTSEHFELDISNLCAKIILSQLP